MNLNQPAMKSGPLTIAELEEARKHSTGTILPAGLDYQGRHQTRPLPEECAEEGGTHREPSGTYRNQPGLGIVLVLLGWPVVAAAVGAIVVIVTNMPRIG